MGAYTGLQALLQTSVEGCYCGRVFGAYGTTSALLALIGMGLGGVLGKAIPLVVVMNASGGLYLFSGVVAGLGLGGDVAQTEHARPTSGA